jgi:uncharacterized protein YqeY
VARRPPRLGPRHHVRAVPLGRPADQTSEVTHMTLKERITEDMKTAMRAGEKDRLATIRLMLAAVKQIEVDERITLDEARMLSVLEKMVKQRKESIAQFESGGRADLVAKEAAELAVIQAYLPAQLSAAELDALIAEAIASTGATTIKDMGKVMGVVKSKAAGRADMGAVGARIKQKLGG